MLTSVSLLDKVGLVGVTITLLAYFLLQVGRTALRGWMYSLLNAAGSTLILLSLLEKFNLSAFSMEAVWLVISLYGTYKVYTEQQKKEASPPPL